MEEGSAKYLAILAVVLAIALASILALGSFPDFAEEARITQSKEYWRVEARPFAITEYSISSTGNGVFVLQNVGAGGTYVMTGFNIGNYSNNSTLSFSAGQSRKIEISEMGAGKQKELYDLDVSISYIDPKGVQSTQFGSRRLVGRYK